MVVPHVVEMGKGDCWLFMWGVLLQHLLVNVTFTKTWWQVNASFIRLVVTHRINEKLQPSNTIWCLGWYWALSFVPMFRNHNSFFKVSLFIWCARSHDSRHTRLPLTKNSVSYSPESMTCVWSRKNSSVKFLLPVWFLSLSCTSAYTVLHVLYGQLFHTPFRTAIDAQNPQNVRLVSHIRT